LSNLARGFGGSFIAMKRTACAIREYAPNSTALNEAGSGRFRLATVGYVAARLTTRRLLRIV
jgi:hypothetical protein